MDKRKRDTHTLHLLVHKAHEGLGVGQHPAIKGVAGIASGAGVKQKRDVECLLPKMRGAHGWKGMSAKCGAQAVVTWNRLAFCSKKRKQLSQGRKTSFVTLCKVSKDKKMQNNRPSDTFNGIV